MRSIFLCLAFVLLPFSFNPLTRIVNSRSNAMVGVLWIGPGTSINYHNCAVVREEDNFCIIWKNRDESWPLHACMELI